MSFRKRKRNIKVVISQMETRKGISYNMLRKIIRRMVCTFAGFVF